MSICALISSFLWTKLDETHTQLYTFFLLFANNLRFCFTFTFSSRAIEDLLV
jgi:hypothetical protein